MFLPKEVKTLSVVRRAGRTGKVRIVFHRGANTNQIEEERIL
jgi:hypothetical protein